MLAFGKWVFGIEAPYNIFGGKNQTTCILQPSGPSAISEQGIKVDSGKLG